MSYATAILTILPSANPAHVEAWMRTEHSTLDALSPEQFKSKVLIADQCARAQPGLSAFLARSYGL